MNVISKIIAYSISILCVTTLAQGALLPSDEVQALSAIGKTLGQTKWNFIVDPCRGDYGWDDPKPVKGYESVVNCDCTFLNSTICHVVSIVLKGQNLTGTLPTDLVRLPYLQDFDVSRNYLKGSIPQEWGATNLVHICLLGNRLTGPIPKELGNISGLVELNVEHNQLSGVLPWQLGNLRFIEHIRLNSNNFTGQIPSSFAKLTTLKNFRISSNSFTGPIPELIQNWKNLKILWVQGSGLSGPIPSAIAQLVNLTELIITDLSNGTESQFPQVNNMTNLQKLVLRSCNIVGKLPDYIGQMTKLNMLDLSFNKLRGEIPSSYNGLYTNAQYIYLTGNMLDGRVPDWMLQTGKQFDVSYNNFSYDGPCEFRSTNLFASSSTGNNSGIVSCLRSYKCPKEFYGFHINCGGRETTIDGIVYEEDTDPAGPSRFYQSRTNWAFSSTGNFMDDDFPVDMYIETNATNISPNASILYLDARLTPLSLTYYGFCMKNGHYTVHLHFIEIRFSGDKTYSSLGRRIFDVYIQGKLALKDFNIEKEAGGVGKESIKNFSAIVASNTLEIRFYWAGKGTTSIPTRGVYGPLISAISVKSDSVPPLEDAWSSKHSGDALTRIVVGVVVPVAAVVALVLGILWWNGCLWRTSSVDELTWFDVLDIQAGFFTLKQIKAATNNFASTNKIGEGGFGSVYKGHLSDGTIIAVKQLSSKSKQGNQEFVNEIGMISSLRHPHLVKLYGCCVEGNQMLLVYEYMENNSLAHALFDPKDHQMKLDWPTRQKIGIGISRGLTYLHEESQLKIVHRDIKASNVLLDKYLNPKISDFGLAKFNEEGKSHISTRVAGTVGYMAPEYALRGYLTDKADVYSFGVLLLEIVSGRINNSYWPQQEFFNLLDLALVLKERGHLLELVDPRLGTEYNQEEVMAMINVALLCTNVSPAARPSMSSVVSMLEGKSEVQELVRHINVSTNEKRTEEMLKHFQMVAEHNVSETLTQSLSLDAT